MPNALSTRRANLLSMELELLGMLILKDGKAIPNVAAILQPEDFYSYEHQLIYTAITDLYKSGIAPTMLLIADWLKRRNYIFKGEGDTVSPYDKVSVETIMDLGQVAFTTAYAESYAMKIKEESNRNKLLRIGNNFQKNAEDVTKSLNDLVANAEKALRDVTSDIVQNKAVNRQCYFTQSYENESNAMHVYSKRKTGFSNIDEVQIFSPGLYVIGATPAAGKTTFCWQLLEQLHKKGEICVFCSYEMSPLELFSKSMARELFLRDKSTTLTSADIRCGASSDILSKVHADFIAEDKGGVNLFTLQDENIDEMLRLIRPYCNDKKKSPVVCLDYLQIVPPSSEIQTDKARIDDIVHKLKTFQRETNTTFIVISSFNRMNYYQQVSFESFKESGNIEYTADVVWALQLNVINDVKIGAPISETRKKFEDAKRQQPRQIQFKCLKNRQGQNYDCYFNYYPAHDYFEPRDAGQNPTPKGGGL